MPEIGTPYPDFLVQDTKDPHYLIVLDLTKYFQTESKPSVLSICLPGYETPVKHYVDKNAINVFNSTNLGITCVTNDCDDSGYAMLPDGIYTITLELSPNTFNKKRYYLKTDQLNIELSKILIDKDLSFIKTDEKFKKWLGELKTVWMKAEAHCLYGDLVQARRFFEETQSILNKYVECKNCF